MRNRLLNIQCPLFFASVTSETPSSQRCSVQISPDCLLLNGFTAFSAFPGTIFSKHFYSVSASLYFNPFFLLHFTCVLSEPLYPLHRCSVFLCPFLLYILYLIAFHVSAKEVNRLLFIVFKTYIYWD